eukprot:5389859-Heterocapsa_arctica.AAC.1
MFRRPPGSITILISFGGNSGGGRLRRPRPSTARPGSNRGNAAASATRSTSSTKDSGTRSGHLRRRRPRPARPRRHHRARPHWRRRHDGTPCRHVQQHGQRHLALRSLPADAASPSWNPALSPPGAAAAGILRGFVAAGTVSRAPAATWAIEQRPPSRGFPGSATPLRDAR